MNKVWKLLVLCLYAIILLACSDDSSDPSKAYLTDGAACGTEDEGRYLWIEERKIYSLCNEGAWKHFSVPEHHPGFNPCQFNFGASWQAAHEEESFYKGLDYISVWLGDNSFYNVFEERMVETCISIQATPMIYAYVIAEFGKDHDMEDCDMAAKKEKKSLCEHGANLIREYFADSIMDRYQKYVTGMSDQLNLWSIDTTTYEPIWMIEPDFYQYSQTASEQSAEYNGVAQIDGGIPDSMMGVYFKQIVDTIHAHLPAAKIAIDISPWISDKDPQGLEKWFSNFDMNDVDYVSTSGGRTLANSDRIKSSNKATWADVYKITGKPILADAGYDAGGKGTGHAKLWDEVSNIEARAKDGVIGVMQMDADAEYASRTYYIRSNLNIEYPWCKSK
ncbi:MAG: hypothetical protein MJY47_02415 [Fibrobacter sp.]|nr:hypothetical protein [Fibrobacter sp.]